MSLQVKVTGAPEYGRFIKALICGQPGAGKTLISSTFPEVFYASAEGGLMSVASRNLPYIDIKQTDDLLALLEILKQKPEVRARMLGRPVSTIVIDTIDEIQKMLARERLQSTHQPQMQQKDWGWMGDQLRNIVRGFRNLEDLHVVFTCHLASKEEGDSGRMFIMPAIQGAMGGEIAGYVDLALLLRSETTVTMVDGESRRSTRRVLQAVPDSLHDWIKDRSGKLPPEVEVNFIDDFDRIAKLIYGAPAAVAPLPDGEALEPEPAQAPAAPAAEPEAVEPPAERFACEDCGFVFEDEDQRDLSEALVRKVLCGECLAEARKSR